MTWNNNLLFDVETIPYMVFGPAVNQGSVHTMPEKFENVALYFYG